MSTPLYICNCICVTSSMSEKYDWISSWEEHSIGSEEEHNITQVSYDLHHLNFLTPPQGLSTQEYDIFAWLRTVQRGVISHFVLTTLLECYFSLNYRCMWSPQIVIFISLYPEPHYQCGTLLLSSTMCYSPLLVWLELLNALAGIRIVLAN